MLGAMRGNLDERDRDTLSLKWGRGVIRLYPWDWKV